MCVCVCSHSNLSMNSPAGVFPNRARPPTDRMKDGVTERRDRKREEGGSRCRNVSKTKKAEDKYRSGQLAHRLKIKAEKHNGQEEGSVEAGEMQRLS